MLVITTNINQMMSVITALICCIMRIDHRG
jgi:hypothetical protein